MIRKIDGVIRKIIIQKYIFREIIDYKKIVNDLPHSNPFIKEMMIKMRQLINHIDTVSLANIKSSDGRELSHHPSPF